MRDVHFSFHRVLPLFFIDGVSKCLSLGIQGFSRRQTDEPPTEGGCKSAKECFTETLNDNKGNNPPQNKGALITKLKQLKIGGNENICYYCIYKRGCR